MKIIETTNAWSIECGDHDYYDIGDEFNSRLLLDCEELNIVTDRKEFFIEPISNTKSRATGEVIFKGEYLLIIESTIRFGIVLNNQFRFGNHNYVGNKNIDHSNITVGDVIAVSGCFSLTSIYFCIFTYLPNENALPDTCYKWKVLNLYQINTSDQLWDSRSLLEFEKTNKIDTSDQSIDDEYAIEFELVDNSLKPFETARAIDGYVKTICWIDSRNWIINCDGRIIGGVKKGHWYYFDKTGNHKESFEYEE